MIIRVSKTTSVRVLQLEAEREFEVAGQAVMQVPATKPLVVHQKGAVIELNRRLGGKNARGRLGGTVGPPVRPGFVELVVAYSDSAPVPTREFGESLLIAGLPREYVSGVIAGAAMASSAACSIRIDRAAFSEVDSSRAAFETLGRLLVHALITDSDDAFAETARRTFAADNYGRPS